LTVARFIALLDASALHSIRFTNLALEVANGRLFQPRWSADIHEEWQRSVLKQNPSTRADAITNRREQMDIAFPDAMVSGYGPLIAGLTLPDMDDRHVLAAAIQTRADVIVTFNLRHFPADELAVHGLEAQHPDTFLLHQMTLDPATFVAAARTVRKRLQNPEHTVSDYLSSLRKANLPLVADGLVNFAQAL
jgi:predicted nucleic acid-binding protein